jgi:Mechanosensitive ion channel.
MQENLLKECFFSVKAAFRGDYGAAVELSVIILFVVVLTAGAWFLFGRLRRVFDLKKRVWQILLLDALAKPVYTFIWIVGFFEAFDLLFSELFSHRLFPSMRAIWLITFIGCLAWFLLRWKSKILHYLTHTQSHRKHFDRARVDVLGKVLTIGVLFIALLFILDATGHSISALIAFGGLGGIALAFASQEMLA